MLNYKKDAKTIIIEMSPDGEGSKTRGFMSKGMIFVTHRMVFMGFWDLWPVLRVGYFTENS